MSKQKYTIMKDIEHPLLRPEMYIGPVANVTSEFKWVISAEGAIEYAAVSYNPGLEQCITELLVNATDHVERCRKMKPKYRVTKIVIRRGEDFISVLNDGEPIPISVQADTGLHVPEMIFGNLRSSSNYDDTVKRTVGGRNGIGAKAANIFSRKFVVKVVNGGRKYTQVFENHMTVKNPPTIEATDESDYTSVKFYPDFEYFKMRDFDTFADGSASDMTRVLMKKVYDLSAVTSRDVNIVYNDTPIPVRDFAEYIGLYTGNQPVMYRADRWEVGVTMSPFERGMHFSFVNGLNTVNGGTHVSYITGQIVEEIRAMVLKKNKDLAVTPLMVTSRLLVFVKAIIENPVFESQSKMQLKSPVREFGSECKLPRTFFAGLAGLGLCDKIMESVKEKELETIIKKVNKKSRLTDIDKLEDANWAGSASVEKRMQCTLILTEGDSAKGFAMNGISAAGGSDVWGVFPLRGVFINIQEATHKQLVENKEIIAITRILGLKLGEHKTRRLEDLRYGHVMIMTDQDYDGFHIKGLLINFFAYNWPELVEQGLVRCMITPVIKVFSKNSVLESFYNVGDYEKWAQGPGATKAAWRPKYYKGLGTSTPAEAQQCFADIANNLIEYEYSDSSDRDLVDKIFAEQHANFRKSWIIGALAQPQVVDYTMHKMSVPYFINRELVQYSIASVRRSIPSLIDGMKPSQRKILFGALTEKLFLKADGSGEIKVVQLAGLVSKIAAYHHGETSLQNTIVKMAQEFVGSGNLNLFLPKGEFGSRISGGEDAASPRYIFTALRPEVKLLFNEIDNKILNYLVDDGVRVEPEFYAPTVPLILLNGVQGIATGWSTTVPCFRLSQIIRNLKTLIAGGTKQDLEDLVPFYKGFTGTIERVSPGRWVSHGVARYVDAAELVVEVTELPVGMWKQDFKTKLNALIESGAVKGYSVNDCGGTKKGRAGAKAGAKAGDGAKAAKFKTANDINYLVTLTAPVEDVFGLLGLSANINCTNMIAFNTEGVVTKYADPNDILVDFFKYRIGMYAARKTRILDDLQAQIRVVSARLRFIELVVNDKITVFKQPRAAVQAQMVEHAFPGDVQDSLLSIPISKFTSDEVEKLRGDLDSLTDQVRTAEQTSTAEMWVADLDKLDVQQLEQPLVLSA